MEDHQSVFQAASAHALCTDENQSLSLECWHFCHFLIDLQLMPVKLCLNTDTQLGYEPAKEKGNEDVSQEFGEVSDLRSWLSGTSSSSSFCQLWCHKGSLQNQNDHSATGAFSLFAITAFGQKGAAVDHILIV